MRSKPKSVKVPSILAEPAEDRSRELGYGSFNAYVTGLIRYDLVSLKPHTLTVPIALMDLDAQDRIDTDLAQLHSTGEGAKGQWLEHVIERAVEKCLEAKPDSSPDELKKATKNALRGLKAE